MGRRLKNVRLALTAGWLILMATAKAGPPFSTDDPDVTALHSWEINLPFTLNRVSGSTAMNAPLFDFNYGLPQLQLEFDVPVAVSSDQHRTTTGLGDLLYGVKWKFFEDERTQIEFGTYPQMFAPTGDVRRGLGDGRPDVAFNVGGIYKLTEHLNLLFTAGRDFVGDTHATVYLGLQVLTK
jgi:hypothetical protein